MNWYVSFNLQIEKTMKIFSRLINLFFSNKNESNDINKINFDYVNFEKKLYSITEIVLKKLIQKVGLNNIRAFALSTDSDACNLGFYYDTFENYSQNLINPQDDLQYYKYYWTEWLFDQELLHEFDELETILLDYINEVDFEHVERKFNIYNLIVNTLYNLKKNRKFENFSDDFILMIGVSDDLDITKEDKIKWVRKLNDDDKFFEFKKYIES